MQVVWKEHIKAGISHSQLGSLTAKTALSEVVTVSGGVF